MSMTTVTETTDNLDVKVESLKQVTVTSGQTLARGEVVYKVGLFSIGAAVVTGTGNGTVGTPTVTDNASIGTYTAICVTAQTNAGIFAVYDPKGARLADATVAVAYSGQIGFTIADGSTDFIVGDTITFPVTRNAAPTVSSFLTGKEPYTVMYDAVDASGGAVVGRAYREADLKASEVDFGTGTLAEVKDALDFKDIHLMD